MIPFQINSSHKLLLRISLTFHPFPELPLCSSDDQMQQYTENPHEGGTEQPTTQS